MAVGTKNSHGLAGRNRVETFSQASSSGAAQTLSSNTDGVRRLVQVLIHYDGGSPSGTATLTVNSTLGANYDTKVASIAVSATDVAYTPDVEWWITDGDAFDLVVPALASQISYATIYLERV